MELAIAKYAPKVRRGPKARKTAISPRPRREASLIAVSYTHLTLPTILLV